MLEPWNASLSLKSWRGSIKVTHYTNSIHAHTLGFLFCHNFPTFNRWTEIALSSPALVCCQPLSQGKKTGWLIFHILLHISPPCLQGSHPLWAPATPRSFPTSLCSLPVFHSRPTAVSQGSALAEPKLLLFLRNDPREGKRESEREGERERKWYEGKRELGGLSAMFFLTVN